MPSVDQDRLRRRIEIEDPLLNSRTTIFLATNGLWLAAIRVGELDDLKTSITLVGIFLSVVWFICGRQSRNVIAALTKEYCSEFPDDPVEIIVRNALWRPGWKSPTDMFGWELPLVFIVVWIVILLVQLVTGV